MNDSAGHFGTQALMGLPFEFLNAKLRGRRRHVYEGSRLRRLADCASLEELTGWLYPRQAPLSRLSLERRLRQDCASELTAFTLYLSADVARFYGALVRRFQVDNILVLLRLFAGGRQEPSPEQYIPELPPSLAVRSGELLASANLAEFLGKLPEDLSRAALRTLPLYEAAGTTAFTEMAVERAYWDGVNRGLRLLPGAHRSACAQPIEHERNIARLLTVLRAARHYEMRWEDLAPLLPAGDSSGDGGAGVGVSEEVLRAIHGNPSPDNVAAKVRGLARLGVPESLVELEERLWNQVFRLANRLYYTMPDGPAVLVGYYYVRRNELKNLTALVEAVHYGRRFQAPE